MVVPNELAEKIEVYEEQTAALKERRSLALGIMEGNALNNARQWAHCAWQHIRILWHVPPDPGHAGLRRAARAALVMPAAFAFAQLVVGKAQLTTFVALGCFALLVMADYGGLRRPRALAYAATTGIGAILIALGTLSSASPWLGALVTLFVGFAVTFACVFGGYASAAQMALLFPFVLAVSIPAAPALLPSRLAGWLIAGMVSSLAGLFLWPRFEQIPLCQQAAAACRALATVIEVQRSRPASVESPAGAEAQAEHAEHAEQVERQVRLATAAAVAAVSAVRQSYAVTSKRPAGPVRRARAFVSLLSEFERLLEFATRPPFGQPTWQSRPLAHHPCLREGDRLASAVVQTLMASAAVLAGSGSPPDLPALLGAWRTHRAALDQWAAEALRAGAAPEEVLVGLQAHDTLQVVAYLTLAAGSNATIAAGAGMGASMEIVWSDLPAEDSPRAGTRAFFQRVGETIRTYLAPTSSVLHTSLRVALGLALAVLLAQLLQLEHAFWVVLGTLSALRSSALETGRTTLQALLGTLIGFAIGAAFLVVVGTNAIVLRTALPLAVFLAAYAASVIGVVAGQAAFTVVLLLLYNLIAPVGWQLGVVRVEDVAVGVGIGLVVGVLLWPRGALDDLRATLTDLFRTVAASLSEAFGLILGSGTIAERGPTYAEASEGSVRAIRTPTRRRYSTPAGTHGGRRDRTRAASARVGEALSRYLHERHAQPLAPEEVGSLVAAGADAILAAELLKHLADMGYQVQAYAVDDGDCAEVTALIGQVQGLVATYACLANQLGGAADAGRASHTAHGTDRHDCLQGTSPTISRVALRAAALSGLRRWHQDPGAGRQAIALVAAGEWVEYLGTLAMTLVKPVAEVNTAARVPWWQRDAESRRRRERPWLTVTGDQVLGPSRDHSSDGPS